MNCPMWLPRPKDAEDPFTDKAMIACGDVDLLVAGIVDAGLEAAKQ